MLQPEHEHQCGETQGVGAGAHHFCRNNLSHSLTQRSCSSSTTAGSISVYSNLFMWVRTLVLTGGRPIELSSSCPSAESTKSTKAAAACGCGALRAMPMPCARATPGCTGSQSIGAPLRLTGPALALYTGRPPAVSPAPSTPAG